MTEISSFFNIHRKYEHVTKHKHNLENKSNSKIIYPDIKLKMLLGIEEGQELTYFTIQKFMNKHFI